MPLLVSRCGLGTLSLRGSRFSFVTLFVTDDTGTPGNVVHRNTEKPPRRCPNKQVGGTGAITSTIDTTRESVRTLRRRSSDLLAVSISSTIPMGSSTSGARTNASYVSSNDISGERWESTGFGIRVVFTVANVSERMHKKVGGTHRDVLHRVHAK